MADPRSASTPDADPADTGAALEALRLRGAHRVAPVRFRFLESLARRAAAADGAPRRVMEDRLARGLRDYLTLADRAPAAERASTQAPRGPLADLLEHAARAAAGLDAPVATPGVRAAGAAGGTEPATQAPGTRGAPAGDLKTVRYFRRTWARLGAQQRLAQSRSSLPENAGPLHSHHLVHRALRLMQDLSPEYLERFIGQVEALQWLEQAVGRGTAPVAPASRPDAERKGARGKRG